MTKKMRNVIYVILGVYIVSSFFCDFPPLLGSVVKIVAFVTLVSDLLLTISEEIMSRKEEGKK